MPCHSLKLSTALLPTQNLELAANKAQTSIDPTAVAVREQRAVIIISGHVRYKCLDISKEMVEKAGGGERST